jgi:hypothetical protein
MPVTLPRIDALQRAEDLVHNSDEAKVLDFARALLLCSYLRMLEDIGTKRVCLHCQKEEGTGSWAVQATLRTQYDDTTAIKEFYKKHLRDHITHRVVQLAVGPVEDVAEGATVDLYLYEGTKYNF